MENPKAGKEVQAFDALVEVQGNRVEGRALHGFLVYQLRKGPGRMRFVFQRPRVFTIQLPKVSCFALGFGLADFGPCWVVAIENPALLNEHRDLNPWTVTPDVGDILLEVDGVTGMNGEI
eukprot:CAMPEP_0197642026 /NCGR_PEP_ID=MMETSP1338-20131121/15799_1 /TAXON_ID=43686 ORGANISM="Pelagodinium beii, Strain RCC1491" /NCGR_SAMPLE_ID=MMETSP1338 /ASSEMBLY_ACC=CAM_ASM_000754 /LENGTH=119 /DNA_ID=CAMNT_0043215089 /DNA_START=373 /DNA_END=729 /DNA_ORIENTATION=-